MRRTENASYQPSRTVKHTVSPKGTIRRITTAVLLDQNIRWEGVGAKAKKVLVPPSPEVLKGVHDIVAGITGYTEARGDQIAIETLPFETTLEAEPPLAPAAPARQSPAGFNFRQPVAMGGAVLLLLLVGALIFVMSRKRATGRGHGGRCPHRRPIRSSASARRKDGAAFADGTAASGKRLRAGAARI